MAGVRIERWRIGGLTKTNQKQNKKYKSTHARKSDMW